MRIWPNAKTCPKRFQETFLRTLECAPSVSGRLWAIPFPERIFETLLRALIGIPRIFRVRTCCTARSCAPPRTGLLSNRAVNVALQVHGGYGFMDEYPISRLYRDQKILEIGEGTNEVQRMVIARYLGL